MTERASSNADPDVPSHVVIAAATYNRPDGLGALLDHLSKIDIPTDAHATIVIVDNSADGNAGDQVKLRAQTFPFPLIYSHQTERGIAQARNRGLEIALQNGADWLAFIDDDEFPTAGWLSHMLACAKRYDAVAVVGRLLPQFDGEPPRWIDDGGFLAIDDYENGEVLDFGNTSSSLVQLDIVRSLDLSFDVAFALTGGEDTLFFETIHRAGGRIVFCADSVAYETIDPQRTKIGWHVRRWARSGNTNARILLVHEPGLKTRVVKVLCGGAIRLAVGGVLMIATSPLALLGKAHVPAEHLRVACRGYGFITTAFGSVMEEYRVVTR